MANFVMNDIMAHDAHEGITREGTL